MMRYKDLPIATKVTMLSAIPSVILIVILAIFALSMFSHYTLENIEQQITSIREIRSQEISKYYNDQCENILFTAELSCVKHLARKLTNYAVQAEVNLDDSFPVENEDYLSAISSSPTLSKYLETYKLENVFLVDAASGQIRFSVNPSTELGMNLSTDVNYLNTAILECWEHVRSTNALWITDWHKHSPQGGRPVQYIGAKLDVEDENDYILISQLAPRNIDNIIGNSVGLGRTGETYIAGRDQKLRNNSVRMAEIGQQNTMLNLIINPDYVQEGMSGVVEFHRNGSNLQGNPSWVSHGIVDLPYSDVRWVIVTEIEQTEALAPLKQPIITFAVVAFLILILSVVSMWFAGKSISYPLKITSSTLQEITGDTTDLTKRINLDGQDEIGLVSSNIDTFINQVHAISRTIDGSATTLSNVLDKVLELSADVGRDTERAKKETESAAIATSEMADFTNSIAKMMGDIADKSSLIASSAEGMNASMSLIHNIVETVSSNMTETADSTSKIKESFNAIAGSIEEMSVTLKDVSDNTGQAAMMTNDAAQTARNTESIVNDLGESANDIGTVVDVISNIASQTNLLALNATIEAAGAGEAGKGFAVVASEVKELAKQTAKATESIRLKITKMQTITNDAVQAISNIQETVHNINHINSSIASTVEEQSISVNDISKNILNVVSKTAVVKENTDNVALMSNEAGITIRETNQLVNEIVSGIGEISANITDGAKQLNSIAIASSDIARGIDAMEKSAMNSTVTVTSIGYYLQLLLESTTDLNDLITNFHLDDRPFDIGKFKAEDMHFISTLPAVIEGVSIGDSAIPSYHECSLGRWLETLNGDSGISADKLGEMQESHERLHKLAKEIVSSVEKAELGDARNKMDELLDVRRSLFKYLDEQYLK